MGTENDLVNNIIAPVLINLCLFMSHFLLGEVGEL